MKAFFIPLWLLVAMAAPAGGVRADVTILRAPRGAEVPEVALDDRGVLHMVYGIATEKGNDYAGPGNSYYIQSRDRGRTFTPPVQLNRPGDVWGGARMERGPKLALGKDRVIHVVSLGHHQKGGGVWYTRSTDDGKTFERSRNLLDVQAGCDNATVAADADGNVFVLWTDGRLGPDPKSPTASPIFMARSTDNGKTFSRSEAVRHNYPGRACGCCRLESRVGADGNLYIAFRGGYQSIRDPYLLKGRKTANDFQAIRVSKDHWKFGCPMQGIPFQVDRTGRVLISWMSRDKAYWSISDEQGDKFGAAVATPDEGRRAESFPLALANGKGEVLLVWKENRRVMWALYTMDGKFTGQRGQGDELPWRNKPTAFIGWDDHFFVVF